jgi:LemA protein
MKKVWIGLAILVGLTLIVGASCVGRYNSLVTQREAVDGAWAQVENVLQRRADLIPNLVATVKGYAAHEREIFTEVADARSRLLAARDPAEAGQANQRLDSALGRLLAIAEAYPQLRANENFVRLQDELAGTENRIAVERKRYNDTVRDYNARIRQFPTNLAAGLFGFRAYEYFEAEEGAREAPRVDFEDKEAHRGAP